MAAGFLAVALHLWFVMVQQHDAWARRSTENRWSFRSVPAQRGALLDRYGRQLAYDEPAMEVSLYYQRFRIYHPVGAAVHGATALAALQPQGAGTRYGYVEGALGPRAAAEHLLAMPARSFRRGWLPKEVASGLARYVTTVLSSCSNLPRRTVYTALREASAGERSIAVGDVLPVPRGELLAAFDESLASLRQLDADLWARHQERLLRAGLPPDDNAGLLAALDALRRHSLAGTRVSWEVEVTGEKETRFGSPIEEVRRTFDDDVPFLLAARLRAGVQRHPGVEVEPSTSRLYVDARRTALRSLLGSVADMDRAQPSPTWMAGHLERELPDEWLADFVPTGLASSDEEREWLQDEARERYQRALMLRERRGTSGLEAAFDDPLMGRLGMRLVETDSRRREHLLWSHLRVESGDDVALTLDLDLQRLAEQVARASQEQMAAMYVDQADRDLVKAAIAVVDARSGDVLAYGGWPIDGDAPRNVPGVFWSSSGAIGSVVKPFILVEQLESEALGRPHRAIAELNPCAGKYVFGNQRLGCGSAHGDSGRDPVEAIADSCNTFFFQCAEGFGEEGLARALRRFGLIAAADDDPFADCWQGTVKGLRIASPRMHGGTAVPLRAIGYGVEASPLSIARAYSVFATGFLPTLGLRLGEARQRVGFGHLQAELDVVREGLRRCVVAGTARHIRSLAQFEVHGKTGTAEVSSRDQNNAWFAGYLPWEGRDAQLCFCAVVYLVADKVHGGDAAGQMVASLLESMKAHPDLNPRYLRREAGR
jgi:cell division protein FtsI/penicillin-binding protein 2